MTEFCFRQTDWRLLLSRLLLSEWLNVVFVRLIEGYCCQSDWMLFLSDWLKVTVVRVIECYFCQTDWRLLLSEWLNVIFVRLIEGYCCQSDWMLFLSDWLKVTVVRVIECYFCQTDWRLVLSEWLNVIFVRQTEGYCCQDNWKMVAVTSLTKVLCYQVGWRLLLLLNAIMMHNLIKLIFMSPPFRVGRYIVFPRIVCRSICLSQSRVCSITWKPLKISSWNFT